MYNRFNNSNYNISIIQNISYLVTFIEVISVFLKYMVIGHSSSNVFNRQNILTNACHIL